MPRICITIPNGTPQPYRFPLETKLVTIGRSAANDVVIEHGSVSSHHCEMKRVDGGYILSDNDSTNGILLEEELMEVIDLRDGLDLEVGDVLFNYTLTEEETETLATEHSKKRQRPKAKRKKPTPVAPASPPPAPVRPAPIVSSGQQSGAADFGIFLVFLLLALGAFWLGLSAAHKEATKEPDHPEYRYGRSLLEDFQAARQ
ncbi:MAG: FHA domain-containing protein [Verrucomicrobiota bacterium]